MKQIDFYVKAYILERAKPYVERRDNPLKNLPKSVTSPKFYIEEFNKYKNELERFKSLTDEEAKIEEISHRKKEISGYENYIKTTKQEIEGLKNMLSKILKWDCSASLVALKNDIVKNINDDIDRKTSRLNYTPFIEHEMSGKEFKEEMIERYQNIVDGLSNDVRREQEWENKTNKFLKDLKDDLGDW